MDTDYINKKTIVALDDMSAPMATEVIEHWKDKVHGFKLNHVLFPKIGKHYANIFCDYKLFDIPNTMEKVVESVIDAGADMISIHINNNHTAIEALGKYSAEIKLLGVTYLTSWDHNDLQFVYNTSSAEIYKRSVWLMNKYGFYGMVCSPKDLYMLQEFVPDSKSLKKICPGIRENMYEKQDQIRVGTAEEALNGGADYLVMGRSFFAKK